MDKRDLVSPAVVFLFGLFVASRAASMPLVDRSIPGPGLLPMLVGVGSCLLALLLAFNALTHPTGSRASALLQAEVVEQSGQDAGIDSWRPPLVFMGSMVAYVALLQPVGFSPATFGLVIFMLRVLNSKPWTIAIAAAVVITALSYLVFVRWLAVPLPPGPLPGLMGVD